MKTQLLPFLIPLVASQAIVPQDLSSGFDSGSIGLQVSFGGDSSEGVSDGDVVSKGNASQTPTFALSDSSGVNTARSFIIMMLDTTSSSNSTDGNAGGDNSDSGGNGSYTINFLQPGFKSSGSKTKIDSEQEPVVPYLAPGSRGGAAGGGGIKDYTFLMYSQPGRGSASGGINLRGAPRAGEPIDVKGFEEENGLKPARAGVAISVDMNDEEKSSPDEEDGETSTGAVPSPTSGSGSAEAEAEADAEGAGEGESGAGRARMEMSMLAGLVVVFAWVVWV